MAGPADSVALVDRIVHSRLEYGTRVCIRSVRSTDEQRMRDGIEQLSSQSRYLRFFSVQPMPSDAVIRRLLDADGRRHIAWGAINTSDLDHPAIGAVHAIRDADDPHSAEFAVAIVDAFQGLGLARMLIAVLLANCRQQGVDSLEVQILTENQAAARLVRSLGAQSQGIADSVAEYRIDTGAALGALQASADSEGLRDVLAALAPYL